MKRKYSLALGWWAAIWLLHIWVIRYIEENNIEINEISWTSMWAIIAAFYALGKTSQDMEKFAEDIKFIKMIDFDLMSWLLKWNKITKSLKEVFWDILIENLNIKLKIIATNIESWEKKIFTKGKIIDAIRASISLPWIFKPHKIWEYSYVDWWILNNLPVEVLEWKSIIAVSALKKISWPLKRTKKVLWMNMNTWFFSMNFQILQRSLLYMMKENEKTSLKSTWKDIIFIHPHTPWIEPYDFDKVKQLIKIWYEESKKIIS